MLRRGQGKHEKDTISTLKKHEVSNIQVDHELLQNLSKKSINSLSSREKKTEIKKILLNRFDTYTLQEIEDVFWYIIEYSKLENIQILFNHCRYITLNELQNLVGVLQSGKSDNLYLVYSRFPDIVPTELESLSELIIESKVENLNVICNLKNIHLEKILSAVQYISNILWNAKLDNLEILLNFCDNDFELLHSISTTFIEHFEIEHIKLILHTFPNIEIAKLNKLSLTYRVKLDTLGKILTWDDEMFYEIGDILTSFGEQNRYGNIDLLLKVFDDIKPKELIKHTDIVGKSKTENLTLILERFTFKNIEELLKLYSILKNCIPKNLQLLFDAFPDLKIEELLRLKYVLSSIKSEDLSGIIAGTKDINMLFDLGPKNIGIYGFDNDDIIIPRYTLTYIEKSQSEIRDKLETKLQNENPDLSHYEIDKMIWNTENNIRRILSKSSMYYRLSLKDVTSVLENGLYSMAIKGDSNGYSDISVRNIQSRKLFGSDTHPIFGYMYDNNPLNAKNLNLYGEVALKFNNDIIKKSSITFGDSLNASMVPISPLSINVIETFFNKNLIGSENITTILEKMKNANSVDELLDIGYKIEYIERQYFGSLFGDVGIKSIESVHIDKHTSISNEIFDLCKKNNIQIILEQGNE